MRTDCKISKVMRLDYKISKVLPSCGTAETNPNRNHEGVGLILAQGVKDLTLP